MLLAVCLMAAMLGVAVALSITMAPSWKSKVPRQTHELFECAKSVCYDTGHAVLEYGHSPRPPILTAKKRRQQTQKHFAHIPKMCSRCVRTVSMLPKSFVEIYGHNMSITGAVHTGAAAATYAAGQCACTSVV